jgi:hypothetical protein
MDLDLFLPLALPDFVEVPATIRVDVVAVVAPPLPRTELLFALPGEFWTCEIALALAWLGPCEFARATLRTEVPTGEPP